MIEEVEGFILKETPYGESSKIINIFTKEHGIIGVMCKGAMGMKSPNRSTTLKLNYCKFNIYYKDNKLSLLSNATIINPLKNIKSDILLISYISYLSDLVSQITKQAEYDLIYEDFKSIVLKIEDGLDPLILTNIFEVKMLDYLGVSLNLKSCSVCGTTKNILTLSTEKGGLVCKDCYRDENILPIGVIKVLNMYYLVDIKSIKELNIDKKIVDIINRFLNSYYEDFTGIYIKSKDFLKSIQKL